MPYIQRVDLAEQTWTRRLLPGCVALGATFMAIVTVARGSSTVLLWGVGITVIAAVASRFMPLANAIASGFIILGFYLLMLTRLVTFQPVEGWSVPWTIAMSAPALIGAALLFLTPPRAERLFTRASVPTVIAVVLPAVAAVGSAIAVLLRFGPSHLSWSMNRDAITSMIFARFLLEDGGASEERPNPLLLPYGLIAAVLRPGRSELQPDGLLEHDVARMAGLWLVIVVMTSVLAGLVAMTTIPGRRPALRFTFILAAGAIPLSWYVAGAAFAFGFFNATLTVLLLLASWLVWKSSSSAPVWAVSMLLLASTTLLATWSPFAVVSAALAATAVCVHWGRLVSRAPGSVIAVTLSGLQLLAWGLLVTIPDFVRDGQYLGSGGGIFDSSPVAFALIAAMSVVVCIPSVSRGSGYLDRVGVTVVLVSSVPLLVYFLSFRWGTNDVWTYFPAKFSWLVSCFLLILIVSNFGRIIGNAGARAPARALTAAVVCVAVAGLMSWAVPLTKGLSDAYPALPIWRSESISENDPYLSTAFALSSPLETNLAVRYNGVAGDYFVNAWLLQANIESMEDPIRPYAYSFFAWDAADTCDVVEELDRPVTIWTRDPGLSAELSAICPDASYTVRLETE